MNFFKLNKSAKIELMESNHDLSHNIFSRGSWQLSGYDGACETRGVGFDQGRITTVYRTALNAARKWSNLS